MTISSLKLFLPFILLSAIGLSGCFVSTSGGEEVEGNGEIVEKILEQDSFTGIHINGVFKVSLHPNEDHSVTLTGDENLIDQIKVEVKDGVLYVSTEKNLKASEELRVDISMEEVDMVAISGAADVEADDVLENKDLQLKISGAGNVELEVEVERLHVTVGGAGNLKLAGEADDSNVTISGAGNLESYELKTHATKINMSGAGNVEVFADEKLDISLSGLGRVSYKGAPADVKKKVSGLGVVSEG